MGQLEDMSAFVRVVDAGGVGKAADQLGVVKSAISRRLAELENRLGVRLINRTTRSLGLTEAGYQYYDRAIKVLADVAELNSITSDTNTKLEGTIRISTPVSFSVAHLTPAIREFVELHKGLNIVLNFSDRHVDLVEEGVDLAIRIGELGDSTLRARKIAPINMVICASPEYLRLHGTPNSPEDLKDHQLLQYLGSGSASWRLRGSQGEYVIGGDAKIKANNGDFLRDMAIAGHGIILTPTFIVWQALLEKKLVTVLENYTLNHLAAYAVYPQTRYLSQRARVFIDFLVDYYGENPYWDDYR